MSVSVRAWPEAQPSRQCNLMGRTGAQRTSSTDDTLHFFIPKHNRISYKSRAAATPGKFLPRPFEHGIPCDNHYQRR